MISDRILGIEESSTLAMAQRCRNLINEGKNIINLSLGEPDFNTPEFINKQLKKQLMKITQNILQFQDILNLEKRFLKNLNVTTI